MSTKKAVHLQGGMLQARTNHYHVLGPPPKPTEKNPWKKCMEKNAWRRRKTHGHTIPLTREHTLKPPNQATHSITPSLTPLCTPPSQAPTLPGTHPPRHSPSHLHVLATHFLTHALTNMHTFPKLPPLQELTCSGQRLTCSGLT